MKTEDFENPELLVAFVQQALDDSAFEEARSAVADVETIFGESAVAHHVAGLVWERSFLEESARGKEPPMEYYERAEGHYRKALALDPEHEPMHKARLFRCLFILGGQYDDVTRMREAQRLARDLTLTAETATEAENMQRDLGVLLTMIGKATDQRDDWLEAAAHLEKLRSPEGGGAEAFFHHYYLGMAQRAIGQMDEDEAVLRNAIANFEHCLRDGLGNRGVEYLLADCLVQLSKPSAAEIMRMDALVAELTKGAGAETFLGSLRTRWELRHRLLEEQ